MFVTADLYDAHHEMVQVLNMQFRSFGKVRAFAGPAATLQTSENHHPVRPALEGPREGHVLVVDGEGHLTTGLMGDRLAALALQNGRAGAVLLGAVRDSVGIDALDIGVKALGTTARRAWTALEGRRDIVLTVAGATLHPGDWIYADEDAVLVSRERLAA